MPQGSIRAWSEDSALFFSVSANAGRAAAKRAQAEFRRDFRTPLLDAADPGGAVLAELAWGDDIDLPGGIGDGAFTAAAAAGATGFVNTAHLVELAFVDRVRPPNRPLEDDDFEASLILSSGDSADLLWGDPVQIIKRDNGTARVRARGLFGDIDENRLTSAALLEIYIIDVGQGDGVLTRFPNGAHMLIDGGLEREKQMTGKNAADFVDWKFFSDYGHWRIDLDWMIASHSDADHYGGLRDLVDMDLAAREELDCIDVAIAKFGHPGLARFPGAVEEEGLGPRAAVDGRDAFVTLMGDRADATARVNGTSPDGVNFSSRDQWWRRFVKAVLDNDADTEFVRIGIDKADAGAGTLPELSSEGGCAIKIVGPVFLDNNGQPALPDLTPGRNRKSINTNGHSVCLRFDFGDARILMTGDLNTASMNWIDECFGDHMDEWACDVAKACHHGSHDVSFKFLKEVNAAATVISSGDNEGHAHPRPEIVAASALSGHLELSPDQDKVITPLIYMTEIERSVLLGEINRIEVRNLGAAGTDATVLGKPVEEFARSEFMNESDWQAIDNLGDNASSDDRDDIKDAARDREQPRLEALEASEANLGTRATVYTRRPAGVIDVQYPRERLRRARIMDKNVYGLVNIRTDGDLIMCATKRDDGERWLIHFFSARFGA